MNVIVRLNVRWAITTPRETQVMSAISVTMANASTKRTATGILDTLTIWIYSKILKFLFVRSKWKQSDSLKPDNLLTSGDINLENICIIR